MANGSLLDRLMDRGDGDRLSLGTLREHLRRDLEAMLNSRRHLLSWSPDLDQLDQSLLNYGLDDLSNEALSSSDFRARFVEDVERLVRRLEPRIGRFEVEILPNADELDRTLRFRISGVVILSGERQELHFDSHVDPVRAQLVMRG
ncbi:MAG TPA: type VI secretion system baseplate subunit TssE [Sphingomonas sp.]|jgi:type VI secretion system protein ImpF|uniref:type VI secretion system baseplate subunit TssE n=1 Tax=Sphingomonas sp. TaxID=28214 RepID=UPI002EDA42F4